MSMNVPAAGLRLMPGLTMSGIVHTSTSTSTSTNSLLSHPVFVHCVIYEAVKESFLSHKR